MKLGDRLKAIRMDRGKNHAEVAAELGCHKTNLVHIEGNRQLPSVTQLRILARLFECSMEQLLEGDLPLRASAPPERQEREMTREEMEALYGAPEPWIPTEKKPHDEVA